MEFLIVFLVLFLIFMLFMLYRNNWVYKKRIEIINDVGGVYLYSDYMSYDDMFYRFWIWDIEKLKNPERN